MSPKLSWTRKCVFLASAVGTGCLAIYAYETTKGSAVLSTPEIESLAITQKRLPQYGPNFKVKQCLSFNLPDFVELDKIRDFETRRSDVWIVSYPKSGTTWVEEIVFMLLNRWHEDYHMSQAIEKAVKTNLDERIPFIEFPCPGRDAIDQLPSPRIIKSHLPLSLLPPSVLECPATKIIYVTRNPRDVAVSLFHFMGILTEVQMADGFDFSDFIEDFFSGDLPYSPYVPHVASYVSASQLPGINRRILIVHFEELKTNFKREVDRISKFLRVGPYSPVELDWIRHFTSFAVLRNIKTCNYSWFQDLGIIKKGGEFMRKGAIGDWVNYLNAEQIRRFEREIEEPLKRLCGHQNINLDPQIREESSLKVTEE